MIATTGASFVGRPKLAGAGVAATLPCGRVDLRAYQPASRDSQHAIETAIRGMGVTLNSVLLLLPPKVAIPVGVAVRAVTHVLDRGLDVGLGR